MNGTNGVRDHRQNSTARARHIKHHQNNDIPSIDYRIRGFFNLKSSTEMRKLLKEFLDETDLTNEGDIFGKAMYLAQHPQAFDENTRPPESGLQINQKQKEALERDADPVWSVDPPERPTRGFQLAWPDFKKWQKIPAPVLRIISVCAIGAMIQGMDQAAVNGAQTLYLPALGLPVLPGGDESDGDTCSVNPHHDVLVKAGLVNAAPYLCCVISCWFTPILNRFLGRRGTIFWCALFSFVFALAQAFVQSWQQLFAIRLLLGLGIGPKSATIPIYAAEIAPSNIRGSLVTCWQAFTALGIAIGSILSPLLRIGGDIRDPAKCNLDAQDSMDQQKLLYFNCSWNWRIILASPMFLPVLLAYSVYFCHESPRWTVYKAHRMQRQLQPKRAEYYYQKALHDLEALSRDRLLAARDMFSYFFLLRQEYRVARELRDNPSKTWLGSKLTQLFGRRQRRARRSITASLICMLAQQFCGVNVFIYYSNYILESSLSNTCDPIKNGTLALWFTMGFGLINFIFALPAFLLVDMVGRRTLLLTTFPFLALSHTFAAISSAQMSRSAQKPQNGLFLTGFFLFSIFYSPGEGPVPFVYASESMPLHIREQGVGFVTSVNWLFNWLVAFTAPFIFNPSSSFGPQGGFSLYAIFCIMLWILVFLFVPETRLLSLEQLDTVFEEVKTREFIRHSYHVLEWRIGRRKNHPGILYEDRATNDDENSLTYSDIHHSFDERASFVEGFDRNERRDTVQSSQDTYEMRARHTTSHTSTLSIPRRPVAQSSPSLSNQDTIDETDDVERGTSSQRRNSNSHIHEIDF